MKLVETLVDDNFSLTRKMRTAFDTLMKQKGLTLARARILMRLQRAGAGETQKALADELDIEGATLVRLLDGLQQTDCIARMPVDGDRRANAVVLTEQGRKRALDVEHSFAEFRSVILKDIPEQDLAVARRVILQMQSNVEHLS